MPTTADADTAKSPAGPVAPPIARGVPLFGQLPLLSWNKLDHLLTLQKQYGDVYRLDLGVTNLIALNHPDHAQHVLRDKAKLYGKGNALWDAIRGLIGNGLPASEGTFWLRQRRMIQPHFHRDRLVAMAHLMVDAIDEELRGFDKYAITGEPLDLFREMTRITMRVIVRTMFGAKLASETADLVGREMGYVLDYLLMGMMVKRLPSWVPIPGRQRFADSLRRLDAVLFELIAKRKQQPDRQGGELLDMLLDAVDAETGQRMTDRELRDEAMAMFLAGYETTSATLSFAFHHLGESPSVQKQVVAELDSQLAGRRPEFADQRQLPLTLAVVQESLRLHGPVYWVLRTAEEDDVISGYQIRKGQEVAVLSYVIHRHPQLWKEPLRFDPSRFLPGAPPLAHPLQLMPFGVGQRICVGKEFALMEGVFILARILSHYDVVPVAGRSAKVHVGTTLRPQDGVWVRIRRRAR